MNIVGSLEKLNLTLPEPAKPAANYVPACLAGDLIFISGQLPIDDKGQLWCGQLGDNVDIATGIQAAKWSCLQVLAQCQHILNSEKRQLKHCIKLTGFVNAHPSFVDHPKIINGASDLLIACFNEAGRHARAAVGCSSLPLGAMVEIEGIFLTAKE